MNNLLRANFYRLWRSKAFWVCAAAAFAVTAGSVCLSLSVSPRALEHWDQSMLAYFRVPLYAAAAFAALFIGTDYAENTLRNKLTVGKTRLSVYMANFVTVTVGGLIITAAGQIPPAAVALYAGSECISMSAESFAAGMAVCVAAVLGTCAFCTFIGMSVAKKSAAVVLTLALMIGANAVAPELKKMLDVPESYVVTVTSMDGEYKGEYEEANPEAVTGFARTVLETVYNTLPFGAVEQAHRETPARTLPPLCAVGVLAVSTGIGALAFKKKDLK